MKSAGPLAFAPEGILLVGDPLGATIFAIDTGDRTPSSGGAINVPGIDGKVAALLGTDAKGAQIVDMAVNPISKNAYLSVARGQGAQAKPVLLKVDQSGKMSEVSLSNVAFMRRLPSRRLRRMPKPRIARARAKRTSRSPIWRTSTAA